MEDTLKLILTEIKEIRNDISDMKNVQGALTSNQEEFKKRMDSLASNQEEFKKQQFILIAGQKRIENKLDKLNTNVITSMGDYTDKIIHHFDDTAQVLNKRIFKVETELEGKSRQ
jgi:predicted nuclease with TOPRIM domain